MLNQTSKDFEWLVIDDGSTDNTEALIQSYIAENKIIIRYEKQPNSGKHIAINRALEISRGSYLVTIDSDDWAVENCIEVCESLSQKIEGKTDFAGFTFIHTSPKPAEVMARYGKKYWTEIDTYQWDFMGEMNFVCKIEIVRKFPFPVFKNEKFCQESVQISSIVRKYKFLFTDHILAHGYYLEDGLTQNMYKHLLENPHYAMLSFRTKILSTSNKTPQEKLMIAEAYWDIALKTGGGLAKNILNFPFYWTFKVFKNKLLTRLKLSAK